MSSNPEYQTDILLPLSYHVPNVIDNAYARATEYQEMLNEYDGTSDEKMDFAKEIIDELDSTCGHIGLDVCVSGLVLARRADYTMLEADTQSLPMEAILEGETVLDEYVVQSLGYFALSRDNDLYIYHGAVTQPSQYITVPNTGHLLRQDYVFMPIEQSAYEIKIVGDDEPVDTASQLEFTHQSL